MPDFAAIAVCGILGAVIIFAGILEERRERKRDEDRVARYFDELQKRMNQKTKR
jgi:hypothetical protein